MIRICIALLLSWVHVAQAQNAGPWIVEAVAHESFSEARGLGVDPSGAIYVADAGRDVIVKLDPAGRQLAVIGGPGSREGEFDDPSDVDPTNGLLLLVADAGNHRLQLFTRALASLGSIPLSRAEGDARATYRRRDGDADVFPSGIPIALTSSPANELYAVDADQRVVFKWDDDRRLVAVMGGVDAGRGRLFDPVDAWVSPQAMLYVADQEAGHIVVYDAYGTFVRILGSGVLGRLRTVTGVDGSVAGATADSLFLFDDSGRLTARLAFGISGSVVDLAADTEGSLYALTATRLFRLRRSP